MALGAGVTRNARLCVVTFALCVTLVASTPAVGRQLVRLKIGFRPDKLGASTTIGVTFQIASSLGLPSALVGMRMSMPKGVDLSTTNLGIALCRPTALETEGVAGCSPNSIMGRGKARVAVPIGGSISYEWGNVTIFMGPASQHHTTLLYFADGSTPVSAEIVFTGRLLPGRGQFGGVLDTQIPLVASLPNAPDVSIRFVHVTFGPEGLRYYKRRHGKMVAYKPEGVHVPSRCPRGGFPFAAVFSFADGSDVSTTTAVPCPSPASRGKMRRVSGH
jgi:hypothetical protein